MLVVQFRIDPVAEKEDQPAAAANVVGQAMRLAGGELGDVGQKNAIESLQIEFQKTSIRRLFDVHRHRFRAVAIGIQSIDEIPGVLRRPLRR